MFGSALTLFAVTIWLTQVLYPGPEQIRELALAVSGVSIARALAIVVASPLAGAWADRHDRRLIMLTMDVANGCISLVLVALIVSGALQVWMLLVILAVSGMCGAFHYAAFDSSYAMLVPEKQLARANAMMQTMAELSGIISPALAAAIISLPALARQGFLSGRIGEVLGQLSNGMALTIAIDAITFFLAAVTLAFLFIPSPRRTDLTADGTRPAKTIWADIKEGARFILNRRALLWLLASFTAANLLGSPQFVFQPLLIKFNLASDWAAHNFTFETALAVMNSMASLGGVIGGVLVSMWGGMKTRRIYGVLIPMVLAALAQVVFGLSPMLYLSVAMIFTTSFMIMIIRTHTQAIWQAQTPPELQGRVFAVRRLISQFTWPLGTALAGWVGGLFNPGLVLAIMGVLFLAFSVAQLLNRTLLNVESPQSGES